MSRIHPEAMAEMVEAAAFYEERAPGLGQDFFEEVEGVFRLVVENPDTGRTVVDGGSGGGAPPG